MGSTRRGFLGALAGLPVLVPLMKDGDCEAGAVQAGIAPPDDHILHRRRSGLTLCVECGQEWPPGVEAAGDCIPGPRWNVCRIGEEV